MGSLEICMLTGASDRRGDRFQFPGNAFRFLVGINELHYATMEPGSVRGNHYHPQVKECILLADQDSWRLAWRPHKAVSTITREYKGKGAVIIKIDAGVARVIKNIGNEPLHLVSCSNARCGGADPEWEIILP